MIRSKISDILQVRIQEGKWEAYTLPLDREGKFTRKTLIALVMTMCESLEEHETQLSDLRSANEGLRGVILKLEKEIKNGQTPKRDTKIPVQS